MSRTGILFPLVLMLVALSAPLGVTAQEGPAEEAYLHAVARHFQVPPGEVLILADWGLPVAEIPVVLFVSDRGGISPDAVVSIRRNGTPWSALSGRYQVDAAAYHVPIDGSPPGGALERAYEAFASTPRSDWRSIRLTDAEIVALVNLRFLSEALRTPPARLLEEIGPRPDFVRVHTALTTRAGG